MTQDDAPLDPFLGDPDDPAQLLDEVEPAEPLNDAERDEVLADLEELERFRVLLEPRGME
ncbi:MAG: DUF5319 family protein, partial [Frankiaceae bacterium]|nr:DUF5319 family protein [Frankiaceae bacterium]